MIAWLILASMLAALTYTAAWSRYPTKARGIAVATFVAVVPLSGVALLSQRGHPVEPVYLLAELPSGELQVDGVRMIPDVSIMAMLTNEAGTRLYALPWSAKTASDLQRLMERGEGIRAKKRGDMRGNSNEDEPYPMEFHAAPQPSMPDKQPEAGVRYERQA